MPLLAHRPDGGPQQAPTNFSAFIELTAALAQALEDEGIEVAPRKIAAVARELVAAGWRFEGGAR